MFEMTKRYLATFATSVLVENKAENFMEYDDYKNSNFSKEQLSVANGGVVVYKEFDDYNDALKFLEKEDKKKIVTFNHAIFDDQEKKRHAWAF